MAGTQLRIAGSTATFAPKIKRAVATFSDGRTVSLVIDTNLAGTGSTDVTGVAKIYLYVSNDASRTSFLLASSITPAVAPASATQAAVASMTVGSDNAVWVAWQGVDNALYVSRWTYSAGALTFGETTAVQAASGVTNRFRALDIDVASVNSVAVAAYEANAATGNAAWHRVYLRNSTGTWVRIANSAALATNQFIRTDSEDITLAWRADGITSNVGRFVLYGTKTSTTADYGDLLRLYQVNITSAVTDNATTVGTWYTNYNINQAAGTRRAMLFSASSTVWIFGGVVGAGVPKFFGVKLADSSQGAFGTVNTVGQVSSSALSNFFKIDTTANAFSHWTASYKDNRLIFGFAGVGSGTSARIMREISMAWTDVNTFNAKSTVDVIPRPLDSAYYGNGGPIGIYGGDNRRTQAGLKTYNFVTYYGPVGNGVSSTLTRVFRFTSEDTFDAPIPVMPYTVEATNRPSYRVRVENVNLQPNLYGKLEVQVASNTAFTTNLKTITQADSEFRYFGSQDGLSGGNVQVTVPTPGPTYALYQGTWYWRARIVSDKDTPGAWSGYMTFSVSHAPVAAPVYPTAASVIAESPTDQYNFTWTRSDTEPTDTQTAYRIVVRRRDTMATVSDTGFVFSSDTNATLTIDASPGGLNLLEIPLDWSVQLRDTDAVAGPATTPVEFTIGTAPVLDITTPTDVSPVTTALPTATWNFSGSGTRTQKAFRVAYFSNATPNMLTAPGFETGALTPNWVFYNATAAASTVQKRSGTYSALITPTGSGNVARVEADVPNRIAVSSGTEYTASAWVRPTTANKPVMVGINWLVDGIYLTTSAAQVTAVAGTWQFVTVTAECPAGANGAVIHSGVANTPATGDTAYVDDMYFGLANAPVTDYIYDSFWRSGSVTSHTPPAQILQDLSSYGVLVQVQDTGGLVSEDTVLFTTDWVDPVGPGGMTLTPDEYKIRVGWTNANMDTDFVAYRVYRRYMKSAVSALDLDNSATTWYLVAETSAVQSNYVFDDYTAPLNKQVDYVVVQLVDRFGSLIESPVSTFSSTTQVSDNYYLVPTVSIGGIASFQMLGVVADAFGRDVEQETLHVVGRGRQIQIGDDLGYSGTLTLKGRNPSRARSDREFLETVASLYNSAYLKNPFGDVFLVALGNVQSARAAGYGGTADFVDITVPYTQIIDESLVARQV